MGPNLVQVIYTAAILGSAYALMSAGLTLTWGGLGFLNLAYGALFTLGGFMTYWVVTSNGLPTILGLFVSFLGVAGVGTVLYLLIYRPLLRRASFENSTLLAGVGIAVVLQAWFTIKSPRDIQLPSIVGGTVKLPSGLVATREGVFSISFAIVTLVVLAVFLARSPLGMQVRAVASNREGADVTGIYTEMVFGLVVAISSGLAGLSGTILGSIYFVSPSSGFTALLFGLIVTVIGGLGSLGGTIIAAYLVGIAQSGIGFWLGGQWVFPILFGGLMVFLVARPEGIAGKLTFDPSRR